jgi:hypothetical protein
MSSQFPSGYAPMAINDVGTVAGVHWLTTDSSRAFTWRDTDNDFHVDASEFSEFQIGSRSHPISVNGINRNGVVIGVSGGFPFEIDGPDLASWTLNNGAITSLFYPHPQKLTGVVRNTVATGINASGTVSGYADDSGFEVVNDPFAWESGGFTTLATPKGSAAFETGQAFGINDAGQIVGEIVRAGTESFYEAAIWNSKTQQPLALNPGASGRSRATDINNRGQVVGFNGLPASSTAPSGFLWDSEHGMRNLSSFAGRNIATPMAISDSGFVVASTSSGSNSPLVLFRVTQPTTYAVLVGSNASQVRGDLDADNVASRLQSDPNWLTDISQRNFQFASDSSAAVNNFISTAIGDVANKAQPGDTLFFYYAGHGGVHEHDPVLADDLGVDEYLEAVQGGQYTDDMFAEALRDSRLADIRKIVILDSCHSGGFLTGDLPLVDLDLGAVHNLAFLAAATEIGDTTNDDNVDNLNRYGAGTGKFTNSILPLLTSSTTFDDLRNKAAIAYSDTVTGFFRGEVFGTANVQLFAYASPDFDTTLPLNGVPIPEPPAMLLTVFGIVAIVGFRFRHTRL